MAGSRGRRVKGKKGQGEEGSRGRRVKGKKGGQRKGFVIEEAFQNCRPKAVQVTSSWRVLHNRASRIFSKDVKGSDKKGYLQMSIRGVTKVDWSSITRCVC